MKYAVRQTTKFRKELKKMLRRGADRSKLSAVVKMLAQGKPLPPQYRDHAQVVYNWFYGLKAPIGQMIIPSLRR